MHIQKTLIDAHNESLYQRHTDEYASLSAQLQQRGIHAPGIVAKIKDFQVAIPSWALGAGGTR
ncbi:MAG: sugar isomerase, partial [Haliscomenobacter sp.]